MWLPGCKKPEQGLEGSATPAQHKEPIQVGQNGKSQLSSNPLAIIW